MDSSDTAQKFAYELMAQVHLIRRKECEQVVRRLTPPSQRLETLEYAEQELFNERSQLKTSILMTPRHVVAEAFPHLIDNDERGLVVLALETILDTKHWQAQDPENNPLSNINHKLVTDAANYLMKRYEGEPLANGNGDLKAMHSAYHFAMAQISSKGSPVQNMTLAEIRRKLDALAPHVTQDGEKIPPRAAPVHHLRCA